MILNKKDSNEILSIAWPTIIGMIGSTLMGLFDTAMVGRLSAEAVYDTLQDQFVCEAI